MPGEQRLVRGHHRPADLERGAHRGIGRPILAADQLDEQIDIGGLGQRNRIVVPGDLRQIDAAVARAGTGGDGRHHQLPAELARQFLAVLLQDAHQGGADIAEAGNADAQRRNARRFALVLHRLEDTRAGVATRLAPFAQVENEQRVAGDGPAETGRSPAARRNEGFNGLTKRVDVAHGGVLRWTRTFE